MFNTAKAGDQFYVVFTKKDGSVRKMYCEIPADYDKALAQSAKMSLVIDKEIDAPRKINHQTVMSVIKIRSVKTSVVRPVTQVVRSKQHQDYTTTQEGKKIVIKHLDRTVGEVYTLAQVEKMIRFDMTFNNRK